MLKRIVFITLFALALNGAAYAETAPLDVESLPHSTYHGPNGTTVTIVRYLDLNWTEVDPTTALSAKDTLYKEVCFEGKFESFVGQQGLKLTGVDGVINFEDKSKRKTAPEMKALDNVWICGTLAPNKNGPGQELTIVELAKLPPDAQRFENKFLTLEHSKNAAGLIELGQKIDLSVRNSKNSGIAMGNFEHLGQLRDRAWLLAIGIKEKELRANDANGCYEIALLYRDLLHRTPAYRKWVLSALDIDPDHGNASKDAEHVFQMIRVGDKYYTKLDYDQMQKAQDKAQQALAEQKRNQERMRTEKRVQEIAERTTRLLDFQAALRTNDPEARIGAITSLGEEVKNSLDLGFSVAAVDILTNMNDAAAINPGLDKATKSEFIEVRQLVYSSLAWRAGQNDINSQIAYDVLASSLKSEKMKEPAQSASAALVEIGGKNAIGALVAGLDSTEPVVCEAMIDGLKKLTHQTLQKREEWMTWWVDNKAKL
ncbi:MAG TPA: hypothetical protein VKX17_03475 [Planctomycetota bacterium]|nr:hypothetical protein [Planctomycetota bacterium]